jgi:hypothetical protein
MRTLKRIKDTEEEKARARLLAHFEDYPDGVFYSRQLEILFEREYFHWVTNRAVRRLIEEGRIRTETRQLSTGSEIKLLWHRNYRFYKRSAEEVFKLVDAYTTSATDGALGMQGEHLILAAFARQKFLLIAEESRAYGATIWSETNHNLDFIFERDGIAYGVEVKNTLGYLDIEEFLTKIKLSRHIGVKPVFAVRALPRTWAHALVQAGGYAMIMGFQFYPWTHKELADKVRNTLGLPVDTPKRIEQGTMQRFENWIASPGQTRVDDRKVERMLAKMEAAYVRKKRPEAEPASDVEFESE